MSISSSGRRYLAWRLGRTGEARCAWQLRLAGYRIIARDVRTPVGEIDLIARRGPTLAFVEVKTRSGEGSAEALTARQRRRIVRAAEAFLATRPALAVLDVRFDLMLVGRGLFARHLRAAFAPMIKRLRLGPAKPLFAGTSALVQWLSYLWAIPGSSRPRNPVPSPLDCAPGGV